MRHWPLILALTAVAGIGITAVVLLRRDMAWRAVDASIRQRYPNVRPVSTDTLAARLAHSDHLVLVDVRTPGEFAVSHLPGAIHMAPDAPASALAGVPRDASVVVYCSVGWRSAAFAERLRAAGYTHVENLRGSIFRWANEGRAVERNGQAVREVHPYDAVWGRLLQRDLHAYR